MAPARVYGDDDADDCILLETKDHDTVMAVRAFAGGFLQVLHPQAFGTLPVCRNDLQVPTLKLP